MGDGWKSFDAKWVALRVATAGIAVAGWLGAGPLSAQLPLGGPVLVNSATQAGDQQFASVGMADNGRVRVFWTEFSPQDVLQRGFAADGTPFNASAPNQSDFAETDASGSVNGSGDWVVTWNTNQDPGDGLDSYGRRSTNDGATLPTEFRVNAIETVDIDLRSRVSRADDDSFVAVWVDGDAPADLRYRKFGADGIPVTGDLFADTTPDPDLTEFDVAAAADGSFLIAWQGGTSLELDVRARCYDANGVPFGPSFVVPAEQPTRNFRPRVGVDAVGNYVVAWIEAVTNDVEWRRLSPSCQPLTGDLLAAPGGAGGTQALELDMARDGALILAWDSTDIDPDEGVSVLEMTKSGVVVGGEFLAHDSAAGRQILPDAAIGDRLFAVVWQDQEGTSGGDDDIYLQRFVRRVVFTDDFESQDLAYWSASVP